MPSALRKAILLAGLFFLASTPLTSALFADTTRPWTVVEVDGSTTFGTSGAPGKPARPGDVLDPGETVSTGSDGKLVLSRGDERITLSPSSEVALPRENTGPYSTRILQNLGTILLKVDRKPSRHFEVQTPYMAAVVKGTTFTVSVDGGGTAVHVVEGAVQVADLSGAQVQMVRPGQTATLSSAPGATLSVGGVGAPAPSESDESGAIDTEQGETDAEAPADASGDKSAGGKAASGNSGGPAGAPGQGKKASSAAIDSAVGTIGVDLAVATDGLVTGTAGKSGLTPSGRGLASASRGASAGNRAGGNGASNSAGGSAKAAQSVSDVSAIVAAANPGNGNSGNGNGGNGSGNSGNGNGGNGNGNPGNGNGGNGNGNSGNGNGGNGNGNSSNGNGGNGNGNSGNGNGGNGNI